jgi:nucleoside-diphosphate-sugar epimerase
MSIRVVTVFGGTGFLGRRVVRHLREHESSVRIASRHPDRSRKLFGSDDPCLQSVEADIRDERRVADVLAGTHAAARGSLKHLKSRDAFFRECWARSCESQHAARLRAVRNERRARSSSVARLKPDRMLERCS